MNEILARPTVVPARALGAASDRLAAVEARELARSSHAVGLPFEKQVFLRDPRGTHQAIPEGNRSAILPAIRTIHAGREWLLSVKGVGATSPAYGDPLGAPPGIVGESWAGEAPYGGQGEAAARGALEVGMLEIPRVCLCPVVSVREVPPERAGQDVFTYRRYRERVVQEHRLVPSDVRLFQGTGVALGRDTEAALTGLGVEDAEGLDAFLERFLATGLAALTLFARTARMVDGVVEGLDLDDVWLDKDSVIAADGALFLVDLESLEWTPATHRVSAEARMRRQVDRNLYELFYAMDAMLDVRDAWTGRASSPAARRESVATRIALALEGDPHARAIDSEDGLSLEVRPRLEELEPVRVRLLDRR